jgi:hypothetical protein
VELRLQASKRSQRYEPLLVFDQLTDSELKGSGIVGNAVTFCAVRLHIPPGLVCAVIIEGRGAVVVNELAPEGRWIACREASADGLLDGCIDRERCGVAVPLPRLCMALLGCLGFVCTWYCPMGCELILFRESADTGERYGAALGA